jgi:hypothetical protein
MAKVKYGGLAQDVRGSLNGNVHSRNSSGNYVRAKTSPVQVNSDRQLAQRAIFTANSQAWRALTDAQRAQWNTYAANHPITDIFGDSVVLSGIAAFGRINNTLVTLGLAAVLIPPPDPTAPPPTVTGVAIAGAPGTATATFDVDPDADDLYEVWCTRGVSPGVSFTKSDYRLAFAGKPGAVATLVVTPATFNPRIAWSVGQKVSTLIVRCSQAGVIIDSVQFTAVAA